MLQNATDRKELTTHQRRALEALLVCGSLTEAATLAGSTRQALHRWLRDPAFVAALKEAESEALAALSRRIVSQAEKAMAALDTALAQEQDVRTRLRAAEIVLANLLKLRELLDFEQRLAALEAKSNAE